MNEKEIELAKKKYNLLLKSRNDLEKKKKRILELKNNPLIQEYFNLIDEVSENEKILSEENIILTSFSGVAVRTNQGNKILVNMGGYICNVFSGVKNVNDNEAEYIRYIDLETDEVYDVELYKKEQFEKENKILYLKTLCSEPIWNNPNYRSQKLRELRIKFFEGLLTKSQDEVLKGLLEENSLMVKQKNR